MEAFTYEDYMYCHIKLGLRNKGKDQLREDGEKYIIKAKEEHQPHDKAFKEILDDKKEVAMFLNKALGIENTEKEIKEGELEKYNRKFITEEFKNIEADIIYKEVNRNVFYLIEHQSTIDYTMPYRIIRYQIAIMTSALDRRKANNSSYKFPSIYAFVIYTGDKKWDVEEYIEKRVDGRPGVEKAIFRRYRTIDVNKYTEEELIEAKNVLSKLLLLEKVKKYKGVEEKFNKILEEKILDEEQEQKLTKILRSLFNIKIEKEIEKEEESMHFVEVVNEYIEELVAKEKEKAKKEKENAILKMIKNNINDNKIMEILNIDSNYLNKVKKEHHITV